MATEGVQENRRAGGWVVVGKSLNVALYYVLKPQRQEPKCPSQMSRSMTVGPQRQVLTLNFDNAGGGVYTIVKSRVAPPSSTGGYGPLNHVEPVVVSTLQNATTAVGTSTVAATAGGRGKGIGNSLETWTQQP